MKGNFCPAIKATLLILVTAFTPLSHTFFTGERSIGQARPIASRNRPDRGPPEEGAGVAAKLVFAAIPSDNAAPFVTLRVISTLGKSVRVLDCAGKAQRRRRLRPHARATNF
jgi:hypothetical protein